RLECAMLLYGNDMDETKTPLETNITWTVKFDKEDFIGKKALLKQKEEGIKQKLVGFVLLERGVPRHNYPILKDKERIGMVTSGSFSPTLKKGIGLGYVKTDQAKEGTEIQIQIRERTIRAKIVKTPFYKRRF
ncbi:glycine cleavage system aminomethyltransferase GcvT, partial [bacterium]|nr:glycine cleavage system aminomethyltransferase GcvT [bacterium]